MSTSSSRATPRSTTWRTCTGSPASPTRSGSPRREWRDPALRRHTRAALPAGQRRADPRELRRLDLLRAAAPERVRRARVVLPVLGRRDVPRAAALGAELADEHVHARQLGPHLLFLAIFGKNVEDAFGRLRYLAFYVAGGFVAALCQ